MKINVEKINKNFRDFGTLENAFYFWISLQHILILYFNIDFYMSLFSSAFVRVNDF